ncbi:MAG TPA: histidine ammonia-lyase [Spirochaetales bacterium]|nr:histidine ammonia-lyase [Spirochaetales bacterium]HRY54519.1 histidine ammonia-lyase [Spirochaetia bacterium]HRZ65883.1 histidine ammonia-lyase [Spirochaetia bacterium]
MDTLLIDGHSLTLELVASVARSPGEIRVELAPEARSRMAASRALVDACVDRNLVRYGITTGFGKFCDVVISPEENALLQRNLIMSHACGVGEAFPEEVVRAMILLRANALAVGNSGIRPSTVESLLALLNAGVIPLVPQQGSLGASGDLAPLSHLILVLIGLGEASYRGRRMAGAEALAAAGLPPVELAAKEGLALINGTQAMTAVGALACRDALGLLEAAELAASLSFQALRGIVDAYDPRIHALRGQPGQESSAAALRGLLEGSKLATRQGELRVQDAYALRCVPQIHGASRDAIGYAASVLGRELNAVTDNPIIFAEDEAIISGGNFHGQPVALAMDFLGIALAELASASERRVERLVNPALSNGLPAFLAPNGGLNSGFMIAQYVAAALVSENKVLAHPASVDSIPSSANQEDHVSMGTIAARKARSILDNLRRVLAIELLAACQGVDLRGRAGGPGPEGLSSATAAAYRAIRAAVPELGPDRVMYPDIDAAAALLAAGALRSQP